MGYLVLEWTEEDRKQYSTIVLSLCLQSDDDNDDNDDKKRWSNDDVDNDDDSDDNDKKSWSKQQKWQSKQLFPRFTPRSAQIWQKTAKCPVRNIFATCVCCTTCTAAIYL